MVVGAVKCPLCAQNVHAVLFSKKEVRYYSCAECELVFMDPAHFPSQDEERERYLQHNNDPNDGGYVKHLMDIGDRVLKKVDQGANGMDFGCGTVPVMAAELERRGVTCCSYDPFFADDRELLRRNYDFITCCEVFEHFHCPAVELIKLLNMLRDGGVLGVKTSLIEDGIDYERWYYANDPSHVVFLRDATVDWIADRYGMDIEDRDGGRFVFRKRRCEPSVSVAAGLIESGGRLLVARRKDPADLGKWEFPGGKLREGESAQAALVREIMEEMGMQVSAEERIASLSVPQQRRRVDLVFVRATAAGEPSKLDAHSEWRWVTCDEISNICMMEGDKAFFDIYL